MFSNMDELEIIILYEVSQKKTNTVFYHLYQDFWRPLTQVEHPLCCNQIQLLKKKIKQSLIAAVKHKKSARLDFAVTTYGKPPFAKST